MDRPLPLVVIGASAGGIEALNRIVPALPVDLAAAVIAVVHLPADRPSLLPSLYASRTRLEVKEADDKEPLRPGTIYFAPPGYHVLVERDLTLSLSIDPPVHFCRPSIDVLFESAADALGARVVGVLLSGANEDGAAGLEKIAIAGGATLVQDPGEASSATMPRAAIDRHVPDRIAPASELGPLIVSFLKESARVA